MLRFFLFHFKLGQIQALKLIAQKSQHMKHTQIPSKLGLKAQFQAIPVQGVDFQALQQL